ncbi:MAG: hypothetical protein R3F14_39105 [Polyangiaceae bacterium]
MSALRRTISRRVGLAGLAIAAVGASLFALLLPAVAAADPLPARNTAAVLAPEKWRAGIFEPLEVGVKPGLSLTTSVLPWFLLSPNVGARIEMGRVGPATGTGEYSLSLPTGAMRILKGYLFPTFATETGDVGWSLVPTAGLVVSGGDRGVLTGRIETAVGIPLGPTDVTALESYAPIELIFAPALTGLRVRAGGMYDYRFVDWLRGRVGVFGYMTGAGPRPHRSPLYFSAEAGLEIGLGSRVRLAVGAVYFNYDQRKTEVQKNADGYSERVPVRSNDIFPTFDLIIGSR